MVICDRILLSWFWQQLEFNGLWFEGYSAIHVSMPPHLDLLNSLPFARNFFFFWDRLYAGFLKVLFIIIVVLQTDMGSQSLTFTLPICMAYENQKAPIKPSDIYVRCFEQAMFRARADMSCWGCCLTVFHKPTLPFRKWNKNGRMISLKSHGLLEKRALLLWGMPSQEMSL